MQITLIPVRVDKPLTLARKGNVLTFNEADVDLSTYDALVDPCDWIVGQPTKTGRNWQVQIILPHASDAPEKTRFPDPIDVRGDGPVDLPPYAGEPDPSLIFEGANDA